MAKFRKRPVVIEAFQFLEGHTNTDRRVPQWFADGVLKGEIQAHEDCINIITLEGMMRADINDWIIRGVKGEIYPCKPDIFAATYEPVLDPGRAPDPFVDAAERVALGLP